MDEPLVRAFGKMPPGRLPGELALACPTSWPGNAKEAGPSDCAEESVALSAANTTKPRIKLKVDGWMDGDCCETRKSMVPDAFHPV